MSGSNRIKGAALALSFGGTDYWADTSSVEIDNEDASGDVVTFGDVADGGAVQWFFTIGATQSTQTGSFWRYVWANAGQSAAFRYAPHGNEVATADQPHFLGTVKIGKKPKIGGPAGQNTTFAFEVRFDVDGEPVLDSGSAAPIITQITPPAQSEGDTVLIAGTRFTGTTAVKFDGDDADSFIQVSDTTIVAVIPTGTGEVDVTVTTSEGTSAPVAYTVAA